MNDNLEKFKKTIIFITAIISVITAIILLICRKYSWSIGILLGSFVSIITFLMHVNNIDKFGWVELVILSSFLFIFTFLFNSFSCNKRNYKNHYFNYHKTNKSSNYIYP